MIRYLIGIVTNKCLMALLLSIVLLFQILGLFRPIIDISDYENQNRDSTSEDVLFAGFPFAYWSNRSESSIYMSGYQAESLALNVASAMAIWFAMAFLVSIGSTGKFKCPSIHMRPLCGSLLGANVGVFLVAAAGYLSSPFAYNGIEYFGFLWPMWQVNGAMPFERISWHSGVADLVVCGLSGALIGLMAGRYHEVLYNRSGADVER